MSRSRNNKDRIGMHRAELRRAFEEERDEILASVPGDYKAMFGQIGFTKWGKILYPVLILSPYRLPNNIVRQQWLAMFKKLRDQDRIESMSYAVYFYGADNANQCYGFIEKKKFSSYEQEAAKGESKSAAKLSAKIQIKIDNGEDLNKKEKETQRSYSEMEEDLLKEPSDRLRGVVEWLEDFEMLEDDELVSGNEEEDGSEVEDDGTNGMSVNADDDDTPKAPAKKKRVGKTKIDKVRRKKTIIQKPKSPVDGNESEDPFDAEESVSHKVRQSAEVGKPAKGKKDKKKGSSAKAEKPAEEEDQAIIIGSDASAHEQEPEEQPSKKKKRGRPPKKLRPQEEEAPEEEQERAPSKSLKKKQRGRPKKEPQPEEPPESEKDWDADLDDETAPAKSPKKKKRGRQKVDLEDDKVVLKKKKRDREAATSDVDEEEQREGVKPSPATVKSTRDMNVDSDGIGDDEESDAGEKEDYAADEAAASAEDEDFEEEDRVFKKSKKGVKESVARKSQKIKHKEVRPMTDQRKKKVEKEALAQCEENYLHLIEQWISAVQERSVDLLREVLTDVEKVVGEFSATFTFGYGIAVLMKETKSVLHDANAEAEIKIFTAFRKKVKDTYNTRNALVPKDYKPKLKFPDIAEMANKPFAAKETHAVKDRDESQDSRQSNTDIKVIKIHKKESTADPPLKMSDPQSAAPAAVAATSHASWPEMGHPQKKPCADGSARAGAPVAKMKTFSLINMFRTKQDPAAVTSATTTTTTTASHNSKSSAATNLADKNAPTLASGPAAWWKKTTLEAPKDDPRALALEFLLQAGEHFATGTVDRNALARSLEAAVYEWSQQKTNNDAIDEGSQWKKVYWDKVYALTAAICGKEGPGSLMKMIAQGQFSTPHKVVALSDDQLNMSFEGRPLEM